jgi:hypothetical protein
MEYAEGGVSRQSENPISAYQTHAVISRKTIVYNILDVFIPSFVSKFKKNTHYRPWTM